MEKSTTKDGFQYSSMFEECTELFVGDDLIQESLQVLAEGCRSVEMGETGKFSIGKAAGTVILLVLFVRQNFWELHEIVLVFLREIASLLICCFKIRTSLYQLMF